MDMHIALISCMGMLHVSGHIKLCTHNYGYSSYIAIPNMPYCTLINMTKGKDF